MKREREKKVWGRERKQETWKREGKQKERKQTAMLIINSGRSITPDNATRSTLVNTEDQNTTLSTNRQDHQQYTACWCGRMLPVRRSTKTNIKNKLTYTNMKIYIQNINNSWLRSLCSRLLKILSSFSSFVFGKERVQEHRQSHGSHPPCGGSWSNYQPSFLSSDLNVHSTITDAHTVW